MFRRARPVILVASIACIAAGIAIAAQIGWFLHTSSVHGAALIRHVHRAIAAANRAACQGRVGRAGGSSAASPAHRRPAADTTADRSTGPQGLLVAPALGLVAPVEEGTSDSVLNNAVGHVPASAWPGHLGTAVFTAHNVTWFSRINHLAREDEIRYVTPCRTYIYRVTSHQVVAAGSAGLQLGRAEHRPGHVLSARCPVSDQWPVSRLCDPRHHLADLLVAAPAAWLTPAHPARRQGTRRAGTRPRPQRRPSGGPPLHRVTLVDLAPDQWAA